MSPAVDEVKLPLSFQINRSDVGPIFVDRLQLQWNEWSPFSKDLAAYERGSKAASAGVDEVVSHPRFRTVAQIVTNPDLWMSHRTGGGSVNVSFFTACWSRSTDSDAVVTVEPSFEGSVLLQLFATPVDYLAWWMELMTSKVSETTANFIPPLISLEALTYLLHAIDSYRRASFQSMLDFTPTEDPRIPSGDFVATMLDSIKSQDVRWLLPAFLLLTPGLDQYQFAPRDEDLSPLADHDFLVAEGDETGQSSFLRFGEAGKSMGVEFYRTWFMGVGFEITVLEAQKPRALRRAFLAPTALANHLFVLESDVNGGCTVNHQAFAVEQLATKIGEILRQGLSSPTTAAPVAQPETAEAAGGDHPAAASSCAACGGALGPDAKFCPSCGARV